LLDREPKESILRRFDVTEISRYFPEFERELPHYLSQLWSEVARFRCGRCPQWVSREREGRSHL